MDFAWNIVNILEEKIGENILLLDIREVAVIADYFVICTGTSDRMIKALADAVLEGARQEDRPKGRLEGEGRDGWVLVDYGDVVVHLMSPERRNYYRLEDLWNQGKILVRLQ